MYSSRYAEPTYDELYEENLALLEEKEMLLARMQTPKELPKEVIQTKPSREEEKKTARILEENAMLQENLLKKDEMIKSLEQMLGTEVQNADKGTVEESVHRAASFMLLENDRLRKQTSLLEEQVQILQNALSSVAAEKDSTDANYIREMSALEILEIRNKELQSLLDSTNNENHALLVQRDHLKSELQRTHLEYQEKFESMHLELENFKKNNTTITTSPKSSNTQDHAHMLQLLSKERQEKEQLDAENTELAVLADCLHRRLAEVNQEQSSNSQKTQDKWLESNERDKTIRQLLKKIEHLEVDLYSQQDVINSTGDKKGLIHRNKQIHNALHVIKNELRITCAKLLAQKEANSLLSAASVQSKIALQNVLERTPQQCAKTRTEQQPLEHIEIRPTFQNPKPSLEYVLDPVKPTTPTPIVTSNTEQKPSRDTIRSIYFGLKLLEVILNMTYDCKLDASGKSLHAKEVGGVFHKGTELLNLYLRTCDDDRNVEFDDIHYAYQKLCTRLNDIVKSATQTNPVPIPKEVPVVADEADATSTDNYEKLPSLSKTHNMSPSAQVELTVALTRSLKMIREREQENVEANRLCNRMGGYISQLQLVFSALYAQEDDKAVESKKDENTSKSARHRTHEQAMSLNLNDIEGDLRSRILYLELWKQAALSRMHRLQSELDKSIPIHLGMSQAEEVQLLRRYVIRLISENTVLRTESHKCISAEDNIHWSQDKECHEASSSITIPKLDAFPLIGDNAKDESKVLHGRIQMAQEKNLAQELEIKRLTFMDKLKSRHNLDMKNKIAEMEKEHARLIDHVSKIESTGNDTNIVGKLHREICSLKDMYRFCAQKNNFLHRESRHLSTQLRSSRTLLDSAIEKRDAMQENWRMQATALRDTIMKMQETSLMLRSHLKSTRAQQHHNKRVKISKDAIALLDEPSGVSSFETRMASSIARSIVKFKVLHRIKCKALDKLSTDSQQLRDHVQVLQIDADRANEEAQALRILVESHKWILQGSHRTNSLEIQRVIEALLNEVKILKVCASRSQLINDSNQDTHRVQEEMTADLRETTFQEFKQEKTLIVPRCHEAIRQNIDINMVTSSPDCNTVVPCFSNLHSLDPRLVSPISTRLNTASLRFLELPGRSPRPATSNNAATTQASPVNKVITEAKSKDQRPVNKNVALVKSETSPKRNTEYDSSHLTEFDAKNSESSEQWRQKAIRTISSLQNVVRAKDRMLARLQSQISEDTAAESNGRRNHEQVKFLTERLFQEDGAALGQLRGMMGKVNGTDFLSNSCLNTSLNQIMSQQLESITAEANEMREMNRVLEKKLRKESTARSRAESRWHSGLEEIDNLKKDILILTKQVQTIEAAPSRSISNDKFNVELSRVRKMLVAKERKIESLRCALLKLKSNLPRIEASIDFSNKSKDGELAKYRDYLIEVDQIVTSMRNESTSWRAEAMRNKKKKEACTQRWDHVKKEIDMLTRDAKSAHRRARALENVVDTVARESIQAGWNNANF